MPLWLIIVLSSLGFCYFGFNAYYVVALLIPQVMSGPPTLARPPAARWLIIGALFFAAPLCLFGIGAERAMHWINWLFPPRSVPRPPENP